MHGSIRHVGAGNKLRRPPPETLRLLENGAQPLESVAIRLLAAGRHEPGAHRGVGVVVDLCGLSDALQRGVLQAALDLLGSLHPRRKFGGGSLPIHATSHAFTMATPGPNVAVPTP